MDRQLVSPSSILNTNQPLPTTLTYENYFNSCGEEVTSYQSDEVPNIFTIVMGMYLFSVVAGGITQQEYFPRENTVPFLTSAAAAEVFAAALLYLKSHQIERDY